MKKTIAYLLPLAAVLFDPAVASAHERHHDRFNHSYGYGYPAYPPYPGYYPIPVYGYPYARPAYGYNQRYYYQGGYGRTCDDAAAGALLGATAGAVIGREIAKSDHRKRYHTWSHKRRGDKFAGTLVGGALGAIIGGAMGSSNC